MQIFEPHPDLGIQKFWGWGPTSLPGEAESKLKFQTHWCRKRERVPGTRYSRVNNNGWWVSSCWKSWLITCQRLGGEKEEQSHSSNNKKHRLAYPGGIYLQGGCWKPKWKIEIKKSHEGIYLFICLFYFFVLAWDGELQIEMLVSRTQGTQKKHLHIESWRNVFSFTSS